MKGRGGMRDRVGGMGQGKIESGGIGRGRGGGRGGSWAKRGGGAGWSEVHGSSIEEEGNKMIQL